MKGMLNQDLSGGKKRICVIGPSDHFCSGTAIHTLCLTNALAQSEHNEVSAVLIRKLVPNFLYPGRTHIGKEQSPQTLKSNVQAYQDMDWNSPLSWMRGYRFLKRHQPDIIVMQWWTSATLHMLLFLALMNKCGIKSKLIIELHEVREPLEMGILPIRVYARLVSPILMRRADAFTTHATTVRKEAIETYSIPEESVFPIPFALYDNIHEPLGDKTEARRELGIKEEFVILHFGMIRKYKGLPSLLAAFNDLPESTVKHCRLLIAGEDWKEDVSISDLVEASRHKQQITFHEGYVANEMVPKYFSAADIVVFPHTETCGSGAVSLTMAYGKPIFVSGLITMRELVEGYEGVAFFQPGDASDIRRSLESAYDRYLSTGGFPSYEPPPKSWKEVVRQYDGIFDQFCGKTQEVGASK